MSARQMQIVILVIAIAGIGCFVMAYITSPLNTQPTNSLVLEETTYTLNDGRKVTCIELDDGAGGGLSCDWDNAK